MTSRSSRRSTRQSPKGIARRRGLGKRRRPRQRARLPGGVPARARRSARRTAPETVACLLEPLPRTSTSPLRASTSRSRPRSARTGDTATGTSFAAPLVSGAAAWVWTVRPELDGGAAVRGHAPLRARHRRARSRRGVGLRDAQRRAPRSPPRADPGSVRAERRHRPGQPGRRRVSQQVAAAHDAVAASAARRRHGRPRTRTRATSTASGCRRGARSPPRSTAIGEPRPRALEPGGRRRVERPLRDHGRLARAATAGNDRASPCTATRARAAGRYLA